MGAAEPSRERYLAPPSKRRARCAELLAKGEAASALERAELAELVRQILRESEPLGGLTR